MTIFRRLLRGLDLDDLAWAAGLLLLAMSARAMDAGWQADARASALERHLAERDRRCEEHRRAIGELLSEVHALRARVEDVERDRLEEHDRPPTLSEWGGGSLVCGR